MCGSNVMCSSNARPVYYRVMIITSPIAASKLLDSVDVSHFHCGIKIRELVVLRRPTDETYSYES
jgi:hypothetical protein